MSKFSIRPLKFTTSMIALIINITALYINNPIIAISLIIFGTLLATAEKQ